MGWRAGSRDLCYQIKHKIKHKWWPVIVHLSFPGPSQPHNNTSFTVPTCQRVWMKSSMLRHEWSSVLLKKASICDFALAVCESAGVPDVVLRAEKLFTRVPDPQFFKVNVYLKNENEIKSHEGKTKSEKSS